MYEGHMFGFGAGFMWLFWILVIVAIVWIVKALTGSKEETPSDNQNPALKILDERYARGEIDREEFEQKRKDLKT